MALTPAKDLVCFGPFALDPNAWQLRKDGIRIRLPQQPLQLLAFLLERPGIVVTRAELQRHLWPSDVFVDVELGLNKNIQKLREALADSPELSAYIETIPRVGYRFVGELAKPPQPLTISQSLVEEGNDVGVSPQALPSLPAELAEPKGNWQRKLLWASILTCVVILSGMTAWWIHRRTELAPIRSLAVLPLENLSGDPNQEYFAEGMTDELITELASIPGLRVVSRTSAMHAKGVDKPLQQIARELDVDAVVTGSVARQADKVRITAQLIDARRDKHLWAHTFEDRTSDLLSLQDDVAREIAAQAKFALSPKPSSATQVSPEAQDAYLRGLYFLHRRDAGRSAGYFQQAISLAPDFAEAHAGVAQAFTLQDIQGARGPLGDRLSKATASARRAIELNANCGQAYTALGGIEMFYQRDWAAAQADLLRGIALNPNNPLAETEYGVYLIAMDRTAEAVTHMRRGVKLDPLSFITNRLLGSALYFDRQYGESSRSLQLAAELDPDRADLAQNWLTLVYEQQGDFSRAVEADLFDLAEPYATTMRSAFRKGGWAAYQRARIEVLTPIAKGCFAYELGTSYLRVNDRTRAVAPFDRAIDDNCFWMLWLKSNPLFDNFRSDARYDDLLRRLKLPN